MRFKIKHKNKDINEQKSKEKLGDRVTRLYHQTKYLISKQLWLEVLYMAFIGFISAGLVFIVVSHVINSTRLGTYEYITYDESYAYAERYILDKVEQLNALDKVDADILEDKVGDSSQVTTQVAEGNKDEESSRAKQVRNIIEENGSVWGYVNNSKTYLVDSLGNTMYQDSVVQSLDLMKVIQKANQNEYGWEQDKFMAIYPVILDGKICYLYNESILEPNLKKEYTDLGNIVAFFAAAGMFIFIIFRLTKDKIAYIEYLSYCLKQISKGNLDYQIDVVGRDELAQVAKSIMYMEQEIKNQVEAKIQVEQSKNELVTNVAHDLRTPLTSIIGYIGLVKSKGYKTEEEATKYLEIAYNKSEKLKGLIENLFELTKLHHKGIKLNKRTISISNLLNQLIEELMPIADDKKVQIKSYIDTKDTSAYVDIDKITRVFENLIENSIKYCPAGEQIYIELRSTEKNIYAAVSNPAESVTQEEIDKFFERFYRRDKSRNSSVEGSGLGLAIAKNIIELHGGIIKARLNGDLICFTIKFPRNLNQQI